MGKIPIFQATDFVTIYELNIFYLLNNLIIESEYYISWARLVTTQKIQWCDLDIILFRFGQEIIYVINSKRKMLLIAILICENIRVIDWQECKFTATEAVNKMMNISCKRIPGRSL